MLEKELEPFIDLMLLELGIDFDPCRAEAKRSSHSTYALPKGFPDRVGNTFRTPVGVACYVEIKAPGKCRPSPAQHKFLLRKIRCHCFAVVVDSSEKLKEYFLRWKDLRQKDHVVTASKYLESILPDVKAGRGS